MLCTDNFKLPSQGAFVKSEESVAYFQNAAGDVLSINYFGREPDIEADIHNANALRVFSVLKARMEPHGLAFIGCYTFPFADCSYVLKVQCSEAGITGMRETVIFAALNMPLEAWQEDPYDPLHKGVFMRNRADSPEYDAQFPDHPLSKVRGYLAELAGQLEVAPTIMHGDVCAITCNFLGGQYMQSTGA